MSAAFWGLPDLLGTKNPFVIAGVLLAPVLVIILTDSFPAWRERRRKRQLIEQGIHGTLKDPGYFRLKPYEDKDQDKFTRADNAHEEVFDWIRSADSPLLYLTGRSGTGKSSLLNAWVLPKLQEGNPAVRTVVVRSFQDPVEALTSALLRPGQIWRQPPVEELGPRELLQKACAYLRSERLLIVLDQFEEFVILHSAEEQNHLEELLGSLTEDPIAGLTFVLVCRTDYIDPLGRLAIPPPELNQNWKEIPPFTQAASKDFLSHSGLKIGQSLLDEVLREAAEIEETKGLIRPITLNMFGVILGRFTGQLPKGLEPGALIRGYLREAVNNPEVRDSAPEILRHMITPAGTKEPKSETDLAKATETDPAAVRGCLLNLGNEGLVRPLDTHEGHLGDLP